MKRFSILSIVALAAWTAVMACGPWARPDYYVFSVYHRSQLSDAALKPMYDFWQQYGGVDNVSTWDVDGLSRVSPDELQTTDSPIVQAARTRGDNEMMAYLRQLTSYLQLAEPADTWDYPSRSQQADRKARLQAIEKAARAYKGSRLRDQYALLTVRALTRLGDAPGVIDYWEKTFSRRPQSVYSDMARGLYAWALISQGRQRDAINVYGEMGDMTSIKWLMEKKRNLRGIRDEYAADPNSPALLFLVQDFVNNTVDSYTHQRAFLAHYDDEEMSAAAAQTQVEITDFIKFCRQVVDQGKTRCPSMWMAAAGFAAYKVGDTAQCMPLLNRAVTLDGTPRMLDNARVCRMVASAAVEHDLTVGYDNRLLGELKWLRSKVESEPTLDNAYGFHGNHYMEVLSNLVYDRLVPFYQEHGGASTAAALCGAQQAYERSYNSEDNGYYANGDYDYLLDRMTSQEMINYRAMIMRGGDGDLDRWAIAQLDTDDDPLYFIDRIGTKLIREGEFRYALEWVEQVPASYVSQQGISRYMARRDYTLDRWFVRQVVDRDWNDIYEPTPTALYSNQKVNYCRDVLAAQKTVNDNPNDATALYRLASLYYQASWWGDCWYLTNYSWSGAGPQDYPMQKDLRMEAVALLLRAKANVGKDRDLRQAILYALAFIPYDTPYVTYEYDADYNLITKYNYDSPGYKALAELADFYAANRGNVAPYISRCDVLKNFM